MEQFEMGTSCMYLFSKTTEKNIFLKSLWVVIG